MELEDRNNCFYHKVCQAQCSKNAIRRIITEDRRILTDLQEIKVDAAQHFDTFLNGQSSTYEGTSREYLQEVIEYGFPATAAADLVKPVQGDEIKKILFSMPSNKAPRPDGFSMEFYKAAWPVVGKDFIAAVQSFFLYSFLPRSTNATLLSLIPKSPEAERMPVYKVICKILARRLKTTLPSVIESKQCAFVKGRLLLENVLLATELVKDYHKPGVSTHSAIKLDISKAFDTVQ